jgi:Na+-transporting methylmalonyl-CoA/oxaloacetate decarboxylase beta subunit
MFTLQNKRRFMTTNNEKPTITRRGRKNMDWATITMIGAALILIFIAYRRGDGSLGIGLRDGGRTLLNILPLLLAAFVVAGLSQALIPKELIVNWLGRDSGLKGIFIATGVGALTPGGPFVSYPLVAVLYNSGAGIGPVVAFVTAWSLWAISRLPLELAIVGPRLTLIRLASTLVFPPLAGVIANWLFNR